MPIKKWVWLQGEDGEVQHCLISDQTLNIQYEDYGQGEMKD